jgi:DNA helicase-2/ATP-dependent DNA helicase PcrA
VTKLRKQQQDVVDYTGGRMGVAAVPGSGKTFTLSHLAARLVERLTDEGLADEQEVLIVTFANSAVNSFKQRIAGLLQQERGLLPYIGYRVRTLHGLAHDIVRMRPGLAGLSEDFQIVDERVSARIIRELAEDWLRHNQVVLHDVVLEEFLENEGRLRGIMNRQGVPAVVNVAERFIKRAKDRLYQPHQLRQHLDGAPVDLSLARMGLEIYEGYQRSLSYRGAVDFDDLVRLALTSMRSEPGYLARLRERWPFILEDEAQDSSLLQNEMLKLLTGERNWVRVGDPNQAIYTTFTTANPEILRDFLDETGVDDRPLSESGRSARPVIDLANALADWTGNQHPSPALKDTFSPPPIGPVSDPDDEQQNPTECFIYLDYDPEQNITPEREIDRVVGSLAKWLPEHPDWTVAVLVPENSRGFKLVEGFQAYNQDAEHPIQYEELLRSTTATRTAAQTLQRVLDVLADPTQSKPLARLYEGVWWQRTLGVDDDDLLLGRVVDELLNLRRVEDFLWPGAEGDWLADSPLARDLPDVREDLAAFRAQVTRWMLAANLPVDQLILTIAGDLFTQEREDADIALAYKLAVVLRGIAGNNPTYRLRELSNELRAIAENQRRFIGFDEAETGYEPKKGVVTVSTMHAAKGLEWDRVYLMAVNNYSFPSAQPHDSYRSELWFVRDNLNLEAETLDQLELLGQGRPVDYREGDASAQARFDYAAERLRLLYVGITRARKDLIITWNMGRFWDRGNVNEPSAPFLALHSMTDIWQETAK